MIVIPAVDLRDGACVQLVGGNVADERIRLADPLAAALRWVELGFRRLHVVDLDAAMGGRANDREVELIVRSVNADIQVGGGVRCAERIDELLAAGAQKVVVGTRAIEEPEWLAEQTSRHPGRIIVAADVRGRNVSVRGWTRTLARDVVDEVRRMSHLELGGVLVTAVDVEGQMLGPALDLTEDIVRATTLPVIASGGIGRIEDLHALADRGVSAVVVGMALYTNTLDARQVAQEFCA